MIQRQQSLWLLLAIIAAALSFRFPFATGKGLVKGLIADVTLHAGGHVLLVILTVCVLIIGGIAIFLYKDRKTQMKLAAAGAVLALLLLITYFVQLGKMESNTLALSSILPFAILIGFAMAYRGIRHDEKLVKSLDKLR